MFRHAPRRYYMPSVPNGLTWSSILRDLRTQILLWTILPLAVVLIGIAYLGVNSHQSAMRDLVEERDGALARVAAARVSEALANRVAILQALDPARPETWEPEQIGRASCRERV